MYDDMNGKINGIYRNIGGKIKGLAKWTFIISTIAAEIGGLVMLIEGIDYAEELIPLALLTMVIGPIIMWISTWTLYGFGEIIDKLCEISRNTSGGSVKSQVQAKEDTERINQFENLRAQGLISEEEYQQLISQIK